MSNISSHTCLLSLAVVASISLLGCKQDICFCGQDDFVEQPADSTSNDKEPVTPVNPGTDPDDDDPTPVGPDPEEPEIPATIETRSYKVDDVEFKMIKVEPGTFLMGSQFTNSSEPNYVPTPPSTYVAYYAIEAPAHTVTLTEEYAMAQYEVTQELWVAVRGYTPSPWAVNGISGNDKWPATYISFTEIKWFLEDLNEKLHSTKQLPDNMQFVLPTEAQWEYAARGGKKAKQTLYAGSNYLGEVSNSSILNSPENVGKHAANELGLYDMSGNVFEFCSDYLGQYTSSSETDPTGPSSSSYGRVVRSGAFDSYAGFRRVAFRYYSNESQKREDLGFRLCLTYKK